MRKIQLLAFGLLFCSHPGGDRLYAAMALDGTFGFVPVGTISYSGPNLGQAASVTLPTIEIVNTVPASYNGNPNDFYSGPASIPVLSQVSVSPLTFSLPSQWGSFVAVNYPNFLAISDQTNPSDRFDFSLVDLMKTSGGASDLEIFAQGILHDSSGVFADTPGLLSISLSQAGSGATVNASFSVATSAVPEPGTLAEGGLALGLALAGLAKVARKEFRPRHLG